MMKQLPRFIPLIRSKLPRLPRRHYAYHAIPCIRPEFPKGLNGVHNEIPSLGLCFPAGWVDVCAFAVYRDQIFGTCIAFCRGASTGFLGGLEAVGAGVGFSKLWVSNMVRVGLTWILRGSA